LARACVTVELSAFQGHPQHISQVGAEYMVAQAQFDGLTLIQAEAADSRGGNRPHVTRFPSHWRFTGARGAFRLPGIPSVTRSRRTRPSPIRTCVGIHPITALVAGQRVQPRPQPGQVAQHTQPTDRDHECDPDRAGRLLSVL
jgi:hypothetical protein